MGLKHAKICEGCSMRHDLVLPWFVSSTEHWVASLLLLQPLWMGLYGAMLVRQNSRMITVALTTNENLSRLK